MSIDEYLQILANEISEGDVVPLVGAGISMGGISGIPAAWTLKETLLNYLLNQCNTESSQRNTVQLHNGLLSIGLEAIMHQFVSSGNKIILEAILDSISSTTAFNQMHTLIGAIAEYSHIVFTTNFDLLIELSLQERGFFPEIIKTEKRYSSLNKDLSKFKKPTVCKLHGCVTEPKSIALTIDAIAKGFLKTDSLDFLLDVVSKKHLLVVGYSGLDRDILPVLQRSAKRVTWIAHSSENPILNPEPSILSSCFPPGSLALRFLSASYCNVIRGETDKILRTLAGLCDLPYIESQKGMPFDLGSLKIALNNVNQIQADVLIAKLLHDIGAYNASSQVMYEIDQKYTIPNTDWETRMFWARSLANQTSQESFHQAEMVLDQSKTPTDEYDRVCFEAISSNIRGYIADYNFDLDKSETLRRNAIVMLKKRLQNPTSDLEAVTLKKLLSDLHLNLANVIFWKGVEVNDNFRAENMANSVSESWTAMQLAREIGDFVNIAKLNENIAHVQFKKHLALKVENLYEIYKKTSVMRKDALDLINFLNDDRARYHSLKNDAFELICIGNYDDAINRIKELLELAIRMDWPMALAVGEERLGDLAYARKAYKNAYSHWSFAHNIYSDASIASFYTSNIKAKQDQLINHL